jgi:hypothetical protein
MDPEKQAELDAVAAERADGLGKPHVTDGAQPYHAGQLPPSDHVPGNLNAPVAPVAAPAPEQEQSNG